MEGEGDAGREGEMMGREGHTDDRERGSGDKDWGHCKTGPHTAGLLIPVF